MCSHCSLFTSDALASSLLQRTLDNGAAQPLQPPSSRLRHSFYGLEKSKSDKQGCIWLISLSAVMSCLTFQRLPLLLSVLPVVFLRRGLPAPHLSEPDTEICAANSLHSNGSGWCHNWHAIDFCLLLQRSEWLMSGASCHNRPRPGPVLLGCSPRCFLSAPLCCG